VIQDLPDLLQRLRQGMTLLGLVDDAGAHIKVIGDTLADAFMSKTEAIPHARIEEMTKRLANLEDFVSDDDGRRAAAGPGQHRDDAGHRRLDDRGDQHRRLAAERRDDGLGQRTAAGQLVHAGPQRPRAPGAVRLAQRPPQLHLFASATAAAS
jgi:hypothetical protein